jgi:hypothetical protein
MGRHSFEVTQVHFGQSFGLKEGGGWMEGLDDSGRLQSSDERTGIEGFNGFPPQCHGERMGLVSSGAVEGDIALALESAKLIPIRFSMAYKQDANPFFPCLLRWSAQGCFLIVQRLFT